MVQPGHADDCSGCVYAGLTDQDRSILDPKAFGHRRKEPPLQPPRPVRARIVAFGGLFILFVGAASSVDVVMYLGLVVAIAGGIWAAIETSHWGVEYRKYAQVHAAWKAEQTQIWLQMRAMMALWPCPTCGDLSCSTQHSATTTVRTGRNHYQSKTDPR